MHNAAVPNRTSCTLMISVYFGWFPRWPFGIISVFTYFLIGPYLKVIFSFWLQSFDLFWTFGMSWYRYYFWTGHIGSVTILYLIARCLDFLFFPTQRYTWFGGYYLFYICSFWNYNKLFYRSSWIRAFTCYFIACRSYTDVLWVWHSIIGIIEVPLSVTKVLLKDAPVIIPPGATISRPSP